MNSEMELLKESKEDFIAIRAVQEVAIKAYAERIANADPKLLAGIDMPEEISLRTLVPEYYVPEPDPEIFDKQWAAMCEFFDKLNTVADKVNNEAKAVLHEFRELVATGK